MADASNKPSTAIIGAGWAGCAAAVELARHGHRVTLFESARTLGGRARAVEVNGLLLDNGQHILLGAYRATLAMLRRVGVGLDAAFLRLPLQMRYPPNSGGIDLLTPRWPAPLHLAAGVLRAKGLSRADKLDLARFSSSARWIGWRLNHDCSVAELLDRFDQSDHVIQFLWRPLCIAALNTPPERASAQIFLNVLRDSLGARRAASDMLLPRCDLSALLPQRALEFVERHDGQLQLGVTISAIQSNSISGGWQLHTHDANQIESFDQVVVATQPTQAARLLTPHMDVGAMAGLAYEPITTCYLQYEGGLKLDQPMFALADDETKQAWGQFVFDRGWLQAQHAGLLAVVVSASAAAIKIDQQILSRQIAAQLAAVFKRAELNDPRWSKFISEKRATFACTPGLVRPANLTVCDGLVIAGDYTESDYPATLESAVRSGVLAAQLLIKAKI